MCSGSIWEGPGSFRSSKTMFLNEFQLGNLINLANTKFDQVGIETDPGRRQERRKQCAFGVRFVFFLFFVMLKWLVEHISSCSKVIRRQGGASLNFHIKWHLWSNRPSKCWFLEIYVVVWTSYSFSPFFMLFWCGTNTSNLRSIDSRPVKAALKFSENMTPKISPGGPQNMKKWVFPNVFRVDLGRSWEVQVIKNNDFEWFPAWKLDINWHHKIWPSWHRNWPR